MFSEMYCKHFPPSQSAPGSRTNTTDQVILPIKLMVASQGGHVHQVFARESANPFFEGVSKLLYIITIHTLLY